jgi:hypothetical protein
MIRIEVCIRKRIEKNEKIFVKEIFVKKINSEVKLN